QPGHRPGSRHRRHRPRHAPPDPFWERKWSCGNQFRAKNRSGAMRLRVRFSKLGKIRWTSHRDVARMWERAFRRIQLPLAYTQGFSPRPKVSFGLALSTGHESVAEYLDVELAPDTAVDVDTLPAALTPALPAGIDVLAAVTIDERAGSLQEEVTSCDWLVEVAGPSPTELDGLVGEALAADSLVVTRRRKGHDVTDDVRPAILCLERV